MSKYSQGRNAEYKVRDYLIAQGYGFHIRSAASKGPIDLIMATRTGTVLGIQVKKGTSPFTDEDSFKLREWCNAYKAYPILAVVTRGRIDLMFIGRARSEQARKIRMMCLK